MFLAGCQIGERITCNRCKRRVPPMMTITSSRLIILASTYFLLFVNLAFFENILAVYPLNLENGLFLASLAILFGCANVILLSLVCFKYSIKPVLILLLLVSSMAAYFMDSYNIVIDDAMIDNIVQTDVKESLDLLSVNQILYFLLLGVLPALYVYRVKIVDQPAWTALKSRAVLASSALVVALVMLFAFGGFYASFFREHKSLRFYANPSYYVYSTGKYLGRFIKSEPRALRAIGLDAHIKPHDGRRKLVIFVLGETARADHFSLNGYGPETNPVLAGEDVISFTNFWSCGTATADSVPCLFAVYDRSEFSKDKANSTENALDILDRSGVNVLWLDNNSSSKGVADRLRYESYKTPEKNSMCEDECRDEGMLVNLQGYIDEHPVGDIFIVLHQMGNHGPAYYKRYPPEFEKFTPICATNQLEECSNEEINNTYDNAILYTDYFLGKTIDLLKDNDNNFATTMFYVSDHGESLGENGLYLHGLPYLIAPDTQKHVGVIMWFGQGSGELPASLAQLRQNAGKAMSHDNIFHTLLGLFNVDTHVYASSKDMIQRQPLAVPAISIAD
jgi:lipid A ethanolaminephosphotransferase